MKIDGRCHCGTICYEAEIDPEKIVICHCSDCQTLSGSAFRTVALTRENAFRILQGEPKIYVKTRVCRRETPWMRFERWPHAGQRLRRRRQPR